MSVFSTCALSSEHLLPLRIGRSVVPSEVKRVRIERGLYKAGDVFYACATPPGSRTALWKSLGAVGIMEARRRRERFAAEVQVMIPALPRLRATLAEVARSRASAGAASSHARRSSGCSTPSPIATALR